jgi:hypothetical protein
VTAPLDEATAIALVAENGPRKPGDCIYAALGATNAFVSEPTTSHESEREEAEHRDAEDLRQLLLPQIFKATFVQCLGLLAQAPYAKGATATASRCHTSALVIKVRHTGKLLRRVGRDRKPPLTISCSIAPAGLRVHLATNGGRVLRSVVGPRLLVGLHRSRTATGSATVSASFSTHYSGSCRGGVSRKAPRRGAGQTASKLGLIAGVAQLVERLSCKQGVTGSSPVSGLGEPAC